MSEPILVLEGRSAVLRIDNVDTDQIIPSREMRTVGRQGLGQGLFAGWRYDDPVARTPNPSFALNRPEAEGATVLVSGANFGCGSSREHAVWSLAEYGFRAVVAESFGAIFRGNCVRNGILPVALPGEALDGWENGERVRIDLPAQTIQRDGRAVARFQIDPYAKRLLTEGLDPIGLTLRDEAKIGAFLERDRKRRPWLYPER